MKYLVLVLALVACSDGDDTKLSVDELMKPETCMECHPKHYQQWSGSMHAYAAEDPVFVAMNNRGQRETNGKLGKFCVSCHAPMAVALGLTTGENFDPAALPSHAKGVTCYFCHNVTDVTTIHNNGLTLAMDQTMRGGLENPRSSPAHGSKYDRLMDSDRNESEMCGSCHDVHVPAELNGVPGGVAVERTFKEWQSTFFFTDKSPNIHLTCGGCHMPSSSDVVADFEGVTLRPNGFHEHAWPAVDQALTPFPETQMQAELIERDLKGAVAIIGPNPLGGGAPLGGICLTPEGGGRITVRADTINVGHAFPSGVAQDRRVWVQVTAYDANNNVLFESGKVPAGMDPEQINDPNLFGMWDRVYKADNTKAHFFWEIARSDPSWMLRPPVTNDPTNPLVDHSSTR
ncbi:MAG TPA: ammonia-forming cytochrome c nitrite reductase subunit c552, partial [Kofleriaceae bacterium]|nr:ammonia-forming cytochrome c nitrite reductase subunit c552 [Kofleriaceae bacterium]